MPGVRQVKAQLSAYLAEVQDGSDVLITDRGRAIARLVPVAVGSQTVARLLEYLAEEGAIDQPETPRHQAMPAPLSLAPGPAASALVRDDRR